MNKLIIGLLVVAAGAGIFLLLRKKKETTIANDIQKELIIGKWIPITIGTNFSKYQFDFLKDGNVIRSLNDSAKADTSHYEWNKASELVWKEKASDSLGKVYVVAKLTSDSLHVQDTDSSTVVFTKVK